MLRFWKIPLALASKADIPAVAATFPRANDYSLITDKLRNNIALKHLLVNVLILYSTLSYFTPLGSTFYYSFYHWNLLLLLFFSPRTNTHRLTFPIAIYKHALAYGNLSVSRTPPLWTTLLFMKMKNKKRQNVLYCWNKYNKKYVKKKQ